MISGEHKKHGDIARSTGGNWAKVEFAIMGTTCENIKNLASEILTALGSNWNCGYADAQHAEEPSSFSQEIFIESASTIFTSHEKYQEIIHTSLGGSFQMREAFRDLDLLIVNGNHHLASKQILVLDPVKKNSIQKKLDKLSSVELILLTEKSGDEYDFLKDSIANWNEIPRYDFDDKAGIIKFLEIKLSNSVPKINGLVLTGGNSSRMGTSKSKMDWHGKEQQYYAADLLSKFCEKVFLSCTEEQEAGIDKNYNPLSDSFIGLGPMSGILSAFRFEPNSAWLVLACDLPLADEEIISELIAERKPKYMATAFESELDSFPEPLITIWEPKSYRVLLSFLAEGIICPRKVLRNSEINLITPKDPKKLFNTNTPEEVTLAKKILAKKESLH